MALTQYLTLIPKLVRHQVSSNSDRRILSTSCLKARLAINSLASTWHAIFPGIIITLRAWASKRKQGSSASHVLSSLRASADPWASELSFGLVWMHLTMKIMKINHVTKPIHQSSSGSVTWDLLSFWQNLPWCLNLVPLQSHSDLMVVSWARHVWSTAMP